MPDAAEAAREEPVLTVSADILPPPERFSWWNELVRRLVVPVSTACEHADRFRGTATAVTLPDTQVATFSFTPMSAGRTLAHIRAHDPEDYYLVLARVGLITLQQRRNHCVLETGDMALFDTSHPLTCEFRDHGRLSELVLMRLPRAALPFPGHRADRLLATGLPTPTVSGSLLAHFMAGLPADASLCGPAELRRLGSVGHDLALTFLAGRLDALDTLPAETRHSALLVRVDAFIDRNLGDPDLRPATIAAHHHISVRLLHQLFRDRPETVAAGIRRRRLERCHADLTDPRLRDRTVHETATRWGFRHPSDFSRAFRTAYGASPSDVKRTARREGTGAGPHPPPPSRAGPMPGLRPAGWS